MIKDEYKELAKQNQTLQKTVDYLLERWDEEHKDQGELGVRVGKMELRLEAVEGALHIQKKEISTVVKETIQDEMKPVQKEMSKLSTKKVLYHTVKNGKWRFWRRG